MDIIQAFEACIPAITNPVPVIFTESQAADLPLIAGCP